MSQYQYLISVYQLVYDIVLFHKTYIPLQWIGFGVLFTGYLFKFHNMYQVSQAKKLKLMSKL